MMKSPVQELRIWPPSSLTGWVRTMPEVPPYFDILGVRCVMEEEALPLLPDADSDGFLLLPLSNEQYFVMLSSFIERKERRKEGEREGRKEGKREEVKKEVNECHI